MLSPLTPLSPDPQKEVNRSSFTLENTQKSGESGREWRGRVFRSPPILNFEFSQNHREFHRFTMDAKLTGG